MSILIKGMEMPNRCFECIFLTTVPSFFCLAGKRDLCAEHGINISRPDWCPLIEIPTPHGRLGDLDKLEEQFKRAIETYIPKDPTRHMDVVTSNRCHAWCNGLTVIQDAPTVIEGSEE